MSSKKTQRTVQPIKRANSNPFRSGSYSCIWDCLYHYRRHGIGRDALIKKVQEQLRIRKISKPLKNILWDIGVVLSSKPGKLSHPCIRKASDVYEIIGVGNHYKLHLKNPCNQPTTSR